MEFTKINEKSQLKSFEHFSSQYYDLCINMAFIMNKKLKTKKPTKDFLNLNF